MNKAHININWENYPSGNTPINDENLNKMDVSIDTIDDRVITLDTTKANKIEVAQLIKDISFDESTGVFTITKKDGSKFTIDTKLEKIAVNFAYDTELQQITLTLVDGTIERIDLSDFVTQYEFLDTDTITFSTDTYGNVSASIKEGSVEEKHLRPDYLAEIKVEAAKAQTSAENAAKSETNAKLSENAAKTSENNATTSKTAAATAASTASTKASEAATSATNAANSATAAATSASNADNSATSASNSAATATSKASEASTSANNARTYAKQSQSYAIGTGNARPNEATDNAKYYYEKSKDIYDNFSSAGNVTGVKGNAESAYRSGNVNLTPGNIGAVSKSGDTMTGTLYTKNLLVSSSANGGGTDGYINFARIKITGQYADRVVAFKIGGRQRRITNVFVRFSGNSANPSVSSYWKNGDCSYGIYIVKSDESTPTWNLYAQKYMSWGEVTVLTSHYTGTVEISYPGTFVAEKGDNWIEAKIETIGNAFDSDTLDGKHASDFVNKSGATMNNGAILRFNGNGGIDGGIQLSTTNGEYSSSYFPAYLHFEAKDINNLDEYYDNWSIDVGAKDGIVITSTGDDYDDKTIIKEGYARFIDNTSGDDTLYGSRGIYQKQTSFYISTNNSLIYIDNDSLYPSSRIISDTNTPYLDLGKASFKWRNIYATNGTIQTSDRTRKTDINSLETQKAKAFINGLNPVSYKMLDGTSGRIHYGLIAQDVEKLMNTLNMDSSDFAGFIKSPKKVIRHEDENGKKLENPIEEVIENEYDYALRYDEFIAPLIKVVQEQQKTIKQQQIVIENQQKEMEKMKEDIEFLKQYIYQL